MFLGESEICEGSGELKSPLRAGIFTPRPAPIIGDDSGDDCSASVEWCRLVAALEKSMPLDRRGNTDAGDGYAAEQSSFGDTGTRLDRFAVLVLLTSLGGICRLRPRRVQLGLFGVTGVGRISQSSFETFLFSINAGDGDRNDLIPCEDQGRRFKEDTGQLSSLFSGGSWLPLSTTSCCVSLVT